MPGMDKIWIFFSLLGIVLVPESHAFPELDALIRFSYETHDGSTVLECKHYPRSSVDGESNHDWDVLCGADGVKPRRYGVHLLVREWHRERRPRTAFEILYWVTDRNNGALSSFSSTSLRLTVDERSPMSELSMSQSLENDYASLVLSLNPGGLSSSRIRPSHPPKR